MSSTSSKSADTETTAIPPEKYRREKQALKMFVVLPFFMIAGCSGMDLFGFGNDTGIVYILYGDIIHESRVPVDVNQFLIEEGYTASVVETYYKRSGYSVQKIYIGVDVDPYPLLSGLQALPGVLSAAREMETDHLRRNPPMGVIDELELD